MRKMRFALDLIAAAVLFTCFQDLQGTEIVQTLAGGGSLDGYEGTQADLSLGASQGLAINSLGEVFFSDSNHNQVLKIDSSTGILSLVAGDGAGAYFGDNLPALSAGLNSPGALAFDSNDNLFIADRGNYVIRRVDALTGIITTIAGTGIYTGQTVNPNGDGGPATGCTFSQNIAGIAVQSTSGAPTIYVSDSGSSEVRSFSLGGTINPVLTSGTNGPINRPTGLALNSSGNLFIADSTNRQVFEVLDATGDLGIIAGNGNNGSGGDGGPAANAPLGSVGGLAFDAVGDLLIACVGQNRIRKVNVTATAPIIVTVAGNSATAIGDQGPATGASLSNPRDVAVDHLGNIFIYDQGHGRIRRVDSATGFISTVAGTGLAGFDGDRGPKQDAVLFNPSGSAFDSAGNLYIADSSNNAVRMVATNGTVSTIAGNGTGNGGLGDGGQASNATLNNPQDVLVSGASLYIADNGNNSIRIVDLTSNIINTFASVNAPVALALNSTPALLVAHDNQVDLVTGVGTGTGTVATYIGNNPVKTKLNPLGNGLPAANAVLNTPLAIALGPSGEVYIADSGNSLVRIISPAGVTGTFAGNGTTGYTGDSGPATSAELNVPSGVAVGDGGTNLYICDNANEVIRTVSLSTQVINTVAGMGIAGFSGDGGPATSAQLNAPGRIFSNGVGMIFVDTGNNRVRELVPGIDISASTLSFAAKLDFAIDPKTGEMAVDKDAVALKALLPLPAGINPANLLVTVDIGGLQQQVQFNSAGKQAGAVKTKGKTSKTQPNPFTLNLPSGPAPLSSKFALALKGASVANAKPAAFSFSSIGTFREELGSLGFSDTTTASGGVALTVPVNITLGTTVFTGMAKVSYNAVQGKGGAAKPAK